MATASAIRRGPGSFPSNSSEPGPQLPASVQCACRHDLLCLMHYDVLRDYAKDDYARRHQFTCGLDRYRR